MKVIGAGFGRTGTMSLKAALEQLGQGPCLHMIDLVRDESLIAPWRAAVAGEQVDWKAALDGWESTIDWPGCTFWEQHAETWPDAPVLLNVRDPEAWWRSCRNSIYEVKELAARGELAGNSERPPAGALLDLLGDLIWKGTFDDRFLDRAFAIDVFHRHVADVKAKVPADRLLVYEVAQGWEPLCDFLGVPEPAEPFPHLNDTTSFRAMFGMPALA